MQQQAATAERLLRSAVLHTSLPDLPCQPKQPPRPQPRPGRRLPPAEMKRQWLKQQPWYADWEARLELVARTLRPLPFALLDAACFAGLEEPLAVGALSRLLHAVSGEWCVARGWGWQVGQVLHQQWVC